MCWKERRYKFDILPGGGYSEGKSFCYMGLGDYPGVIHVAIHHLSMQEIHL